MTARASSRCCPQVGDVILASFLGIASEAARQLTSFSGYIDKVTTTCHQLDTAGCAARAAILA